MYMYTYIIYNYCNALLLCVCVGMRLSVVESHCLGLRMLYRDCARPPPPKIEKPRITVSNNDLQ